MTRNFKTSQKNRTNYIYYSSDGTKILITPGEQGVTEADISSLHKMDDDTIDEQRRYNYRNSNLDAFHDRNNKEADDRNPYLTDESSNPEVIYANQENDKEHKAQLNILATAMNCLMPQQIELFKKVYVDKLTNTKIAAQEGVTEAAIRNRLKKIHEKLRKYFS